jgi:ElaB/YqjD/DUF883 family membrane-anchored ribosome-binding protein
MAHRHDMLEEAQLRLAALREEAKLRGEAVLDEVKDMGGELLKDARGQGGRAVRGAKLWVIKNPAEAVGIAFVAGVIATALIRGREPRSEA